MRFAFETIIWGRQIHDLDSVLSVIAACGYRGVEIAQAPGAIDVKQSDGTSKSLAELGVKVLWNLLDAHKLTLVGLAGGTLQERINFCSDERRPVFLYLEDFEDKNDVLLEALTADPPFMLALHPHWFKKIERIDHARKAIADKVKHLNDLLQEPQHARFKARVAKTKTDFSKLIKLLPDTAHQTISGDELLSGIKYTSELAAVHIKDWDASFGRYSHRYAQGFVPFGRGAVNLEQVLRSLSMRGFQGWIVVEQDLAETTPAQTAYDCARWLAEPRPGKRFLEWKQPPWEEVQKLETLTHPDKVKGDAAERELAFLQQVLTAMARGLEYFYQAVTDALQGREGIEVVQLYSYNPKRDELYLLASSGLELKDHLSSTHPVLKTNKCLCGEVTLDATSDYHDLAQPDKRNRFVDRDLLRALDQRRQERGTPTDAEMPMYCIPIFNASNCQHLRYVLNLFPQSKDLVEKNEIERIGRHISILADHVIDEMCSSAAAATTLLSHKLTTKKDFLDRLQKLIQERFHCRAVTILIEDETSEKLLVASTTGVEWGNIEEPYYKKGQGQTGMVWTTGEMLLIYGNDQKSRPDKPRSWETGDGVTYQGCLYAPIGTFRRSPVGVVRITDKHPSKHARGSTMFTHDDAAILDAIIQTALPHIEILVLQERQMNTLTRMTHEFKMPLVAINGTVDRIRQSLRREGRKPEEMFKEDYFKNILDWSQIMGNHAQNARIFSSTPTDRLDLDISKLKLMGDVIMPAVTLSKSQMQEKRFSSHHIEVKGESFYQIPSLFLDKSQMLQVFLNLLANSYRYTDESTDFKVSIEGGILGSDFRVLYSDYGMGVPEGLDEKIFEPGFRAEEARLQDVTGQGIGLSVVRTILRSHDHGNIRLVHHSNPTTFELILPRSLKNHNWQSSETDNSYYPPISGL